MVRIYVDGLVKTPERSSYGDVSVWRCFPPQYVAPLEFRRQKRAQWCNVCWANDNNVALGPAT